MFEEYLQDSYHFLSTAETLPIERDAKRYYRASVFYASGAIEAFINYLADSLAKANNIPRYEICFLNDRILQYSPDKGLIERVVYHRLDDKVRVLMRRFAADFDFQGSTWSTFMEFKTFRDSLVHPRQVDDETGLTDYSRKVRAGLKSIIELMNHISKGMFGKPLRKQLLDLIPE